MAEAEVSRRMRTTAESFHLGRRARSEALAGAVSVRDGGAPEQKIAGPLYRATTLEAGPLFLDRPLLGIDLAQNHCRRR